MKKREESLFLKGKIREPNVLRSFQADLAKRINLKQKNAILNNNEDSFIALWGLKNAIYNKETDIKKFV